jgi:aspartate/methionine/tyrosine aminotransferase
MEFREFLLEQWIEEHGHGARFDLAASTGPVWTANELFDLIGDDEKNRLFATPLTYRPAGGTASLRQAIAEWLETTGDDVQVFTGASEALLSLFLQAAGDGGNVILPSPGYPAFAALPTSFGLETRCYLHRPENGFQPDLEEVKALVDDRTRLILVNTPHNPTGAVVAIEGLRDLHDFAAEHGVQLVVDEVYHPIYHGPNNTTAASLPHAIVLGDMSKALCMPALRVGWLVDRDHDRLARHRNARSYFTISNGLFEEALAEVAIRNRSQVFARAQRTAGTNLTLLDAFFAAHEECLEWVRPQGGFTAFPRLTTGESSRPLCLRAARRGVVLAPGDCFDAPEHFRLGFGACRGEFAEALAALSEELKSP